MPTYAGYTITETLSEDGEFGLYRGRRDHAMALLKAPSSPHPAPLTLERLKHEAHLAPRLDSAWALRPLRLEATPEGVVLLFEDFAAETLERLLGAPMETGRFLIIALAIARALEGVHRQGLVHKDLRPANVLLKADGREVKLTGFGIASMLLREHQSAEHPAIIDGTLAYMSPEQTGRMNRALDYRTDFYSLGLCYYEMLTGCLPFQARDPMEWVHAHVARMPKPPGEMIPGIPAPLSEIVSKLLSKNAEDRYQSAAGLVADLARCLEQWTATGGLVRFSLGEHDRSDRFQLPQRLYGREREIATLLGAFERVVAEGRPELLLVSGYSGVGKTSLVNELKQPILQARALFVSGKFDQFRRGIPYASISQAVRELVQHILMGSEVQLDDWRLRIHEALGLNAQLMVDLVPQLELVIGTQAPVPELPLAEAQHRFHQVFRQFLAVFARPDHPLALFLDDLQWIDAASLTLMQEVLTHPDTRHLFLVGAYRNNEVSPSHPLRVMVEEVRKAGAAVDEVVLTPLSSEHLGRLVADTLRCSPQEAEPLALLVHEKTAGNPYFARQFLTMLYQEGLIRFDPAAAAWRWDVDQIRSRGFTNNVIELMVAKLRQLPAETQEVLELAACVGSRFDLATLSVIGHRSPEEAQRHLWAALREEMIWLTGETYQFSHDRLQQAAYSLIPEASRSALHLGIGRLLLANTPRLEERVFEIASHLNLGASLLADPQEKARVAEVNLGAGRRAKASTAYEDAVGYLKAGLDLLSPDSWQTRYALTYALYLERAECELLSGNFPDCEESLSTLLAQARTALEKVPAYRLGIALYQTKGETRKAIDWGAESLRLFGIELPSHPSQDQVRETYEAIWQNLDKRPIETLIDLPAMRDPGMEAAMEILSALPPAASWSDKNLFLLTVCHMVNLSLQHGNTGRSASGYATFGAILGPAFGRYPEGRRFGLLACDMVEKRGMLAEIAPVFYVFGNMNNHWTRHVRTNLDYLKVAFGKAVETGNLTYACFASVGIMTAMLAMGEPLADVYQEAVWRTDFAQKAKFRLVENALIAYQRLILNLRGLTADFSTFDGADFDQSAFESDLAESGHPVSVFWYYTFKLQARFMAGAHDEALAAARRAETLLEASYFYFESVDYQYYAALALAATYGKAAPDLQKAALERLEAYQDRMGAWASSCPENFGHRYALVSAEIARLANRDQEAMRLYEEAIRSARVNGFVQNEGIANELAARFHLSRGFELIAKAYMREARYCYLRWGAQGKVQQLDKLYPFLREQTTQALNVTIAAQELDAMAVVKASQAISREIDLPGLLETLMRVLVEHAGAERGTLLLVREDAWQAVAQAAVERVELAPAGAPDLPESLLHYVRRSHESVVLDDAAGRGMFVSDAYVLRHRPKSVLCMPLLRQAELIGLLYLENNLMVGAFTPSRIAVLGVLASQAVISLENARLVTDLRQASIVVEHSPTVLFRARPEPGWPLEYVSENVARVLGYSASEFASGKVSYLSLIHPDDLSYVLGEEQALITRGDESIRLEYRLIRKDGQVRWIELVSGIERDPEGRVTLYQGTLLDITDRKATELERARLLLREQSARAELATAKELDRLKDQFVSAVSHDLRTPLTSIMGYAEFLEDGLGGPLKPEQLGFVLQIEQGAKRLERLVNDLLDFARLEAGTFRLNLEESDLGLKTQELLQSLRPLAESAHLSLEAALPEAPLMACMDPPRIEQVLSNLIGNALKFTPEGGRIEVRARIEGDHLLCEVEDTGEGIAHEDLPRLFQRFSQLASGTQKKGGTGLGLSISKAIVEAHHGQIGVRSQPGKGSTFWFTLPLLAPSPLDVPSDPLAS